MTQAANVYDVSISSFAPDAVESQLGYEAKFRTGKLAASTTFPKGCWVGEVTATLGTFGLYAHANTDGTQNPKGILTRAYITDAAGNIFEGAQVSEEVAGISHLTEPIAISGCFRQVDLYSLDANTLADLKVSYPGANIRIGAIATTNAYIQF